MNQKEITHIHAYQCQLYSDVYYVTMIGEQTIKFLDHLLIREAAYNVFAMVSD